MLKHGHQKDSNLIGLKEEKQYSKEKKKLKSEVKP